MRRRLFTLTIGPGGRFAAFGLGRLSGSLAFAPWTTPHLRPAFFALDRVGGTPYVRLGPLTLAWGPR